MIKALQTKNFLLLVYWCPYTTIQKISSQQNYRTDKKAKITPTISETSQLDLRLCPLLQLLVSQTQRLVQVVPWTPRRKVLQDLKSVTWSPPDVSTKKNKYTTDVSLQSAALTLKIRINLIRYHIQTIRKKSDHSEN